MAVLKDNSGNVAGITKFGGANAVRRYSASRFVPDADWTVASVDIRINEDTGSPHTAQDVIISIRNETSSLPGSTVLGTATKTGASIGAIGATFTDYNLALSATLLSGVAYWFSYEISTGGADTDYWSARAITTSGTGAKFDEDNSGVWVGVTQDQYYKINGTVPSAENTTNFFSFL